MAPDYGKEDIVLGDEEEGDTLETIESAEIINADHSQLDEIIYTKLGRKPPEDGPLCDVILRAALGWIITQFPSLDQNLQNSLRMETLFNDNPQLRVKILHDWPTGFRGIRSLKILQGPTPPRSRSAPTRAAGEHERAVIAAFSAKFMGSSATLLTDTIDKTFSVAARNTYARAFTIIQSSGMGKSRAIDEVAKSRLTLPLCLRETSRSSYAYPLADTVVLKYLKHVPYEPRVTNVASYSNHVSRFLEALFKQALEILPATEMSYPDLAQYFHTFFADHSQRQEFYNTVVEIAGVSNATTSKCVELAFRAFLKRCGNLHPLSSSNCPVVLYLDEVHTMSEIIITDEKSAFDVFGSVLADLKESRFLAVFLSTSLKPSILAPSKATVRSHRPGDNSRIILPAPFTELGFDVLAEGELIEDELDHTSVTDFSFMVKFGRPMWGTLFRSLCDTSARNPERIVLTLAREKLVMLPEDLQTRQLSFNARLAVLSVRLLLDIEPARKIARETEEELVASHMRVAFSVPEHREFLRSGTPSESLLAEAAAHFMHSELMHEDDSKVVLSTLGEFFRNGFAPRGERGELVGRLLDILAIDNAIMDKRPEGILRYNTPIPVVEYIKNLLNQTHHRKALKSLPINRGNLSEELGSRTLEEAFANAYIHVTHYSKAEDLSIVQADSLWAYWARGVAFQLEPGQELFDRAIPIHWSSMNGVTGSDAGEIDQEPLKLGRNTCSAILHQDKNAISMPIASIAQQKPMKLGMFSNVEPKPVIAITHLYDHFQPSVEIRTPREGPPKVGSPVAPLYEIFICGLHEDNYGPVTPRNRQLFTGLLPWDNVYREHPRQGVEYIDAVRRLEPDDSERSASTGWFTKKN